MRRIIVLLALLAGACSAHRGLPDLRGPSARMLESHGGEYTVSWRSEPSPLPLDESFDLVVQVLRKDQHPADLSLAVDAVMPLHQHGMNVAPDIHALGGGRFRVEGMLFHMAGDWVIHFDITEGALTERAQVAVQP